MGGVVFGQVVGYLLDSSYNWGLVFALAGSFHVVAFMIICLAIPSIAPLRLGSGKPVAAIFENDYQEIHGPAYPWRRS